MNNYVCEHGCMSIIKNDLFQEPILKDLIEKVIKNLLLPKGMEVGNQVKITILDCTNYYLSLIKNKGINTQMISMEVLTKNILLLSGDSLEQCMLGNFDHLLIGLIDDYIQSQSIEIRASINRSEPEDVRQVLVTFINSTLNKEQLIQFVSASVIERYMRLKLEEFKNNFRW